MTQETKLGLVIGGAFILCFALILSNTQDQGAAEEQIASLLSAGNGQPDVSELAGTGKVPHEVVQYTPRPAQSARPEEIQPPQMSPSVMEAASKRGASTPDQPISPSDRKVIAQADGALDTELRQSPPPTRLSSPPLVTDVIVNRAPPTEQEPSGAEDKAEIVAPAKKVEPVPAEAGVRPAGITKPSEPQPRRVQAYIVAKEDTLSKIARKFYGESSPESIEQIFRSNRSALASKDALRVGQSLEIPLKDQPQKTAQVAQAVNSLSLVRPSTAEKSARGGTEAPASLVQAAPAQKSARSGIEPVGNLVQPAPPQKSARSGNESRAKQGWEWYQVKPKDRYRSIAKDQLGDPKRWKEIFELNKDTFPDPDQIRPGVRIKIPQ